MCPGKSLFKYGNPKFTRILFTVRRDLFWDLINHEFCKFVGSIWFDLEGFQYKGWFIYKVGHFEYEKKTTFTTKISKTNFFFSIQKKSQKSNISNETDLNNNSKIARISSKIGNIKTMTYLREAQKCSKKCWNLSFSSLFLTKIFSLIFLELMMDIFSIFHKITIFSTPIPSLNGCLAMLVIKTRTWVQWPSQKMIKLRLEQRKI